MTNGYTVCGTVLRANGELLGTYVTRGDRIRMRPSVGPSRGESFFCTSEDRAVSLCRSLTEGHEAAVAAQEAIRAR